MFNTAMRDALASAIPAHTPRERGRVYRVAVGTMPDLPPEVHGTDGPRIQGGHAPRAWRGSSHKWASANKWARPPSPCRAIAVEIWASA